MAFNPDTFDTSYPIVLVTDDESIKHISEKAKITINLIKNLISSNEVILAVNYGGGKTTKNNGNFLVNKIEKLGNFKNQLNNRNELIDFLDKYRCILVINQYNSDWYAYDTSKIIGPPTEKQYVKLSYHNPSQPDRTHAKVTIKVDSRGNLIGEQINLFK